MTSKTIILLFRLPFKLFEKVCHLTDWILFGVRFILAKNAF